jgi:DNA-binding MarR family transcriptional regulator
VAAHEDAGVAAPEDADLVSWWGLVIEGFTATMRHVGTEVEASSGLGQAPAEVMLRLGRTPGGRLPMSRIARESALSSGGFTKVADKLTELGLVRRVPSDNDRRVTYVELTRQGSALAEKIEARTAEVLRHRLLEVVGVDDAYRMSEVMRQLRDAG